MKPCFLLLNPDLSSEETLLCDSVAAPLLVHTAAHHKEGIMGTLKLTRPP